MKNLKTNIHFGILSFGLLAFSLLQTSCTSLQQTTASIAKDDLYDTPTREVSNEVEVNTNTAQEENYQEYQNYQDDRFLRLKVANRNRWNTIDDFGYWNNPSYRMSLAMGYGMGIGGWGFGNIGWGWDPWFGGWGGGFGGWGGGFGGWGWNPYFAGYWNPYGPIFNGGGIGFPNNVVRFRERIPMQPSRTNLAGYNNNNRSFNGSSFRPNTNLNSGRSRNINSATVNNNNFGSLMRRAVSSNAAYNNRTNNSNSLERPSRFSNNNNFNSAPVRSNSSPSFNGGGGGGGFSGGSSGGGNFIGGGRRGGGGR